MPIRQALAFALKVLISGLVLWAVTRSIDFAAVTGSMRMASPLLLALGLLCTVSSLLIAGLRWWVVLQGIGQHSRPMVSISLFWIGFFLSQILPSAVGDGLRVWLAVQSGDRLQPTVNSVIIERASMLLALVFIVAALQPLLVQRIGVFGYGWFPASAALAGALGLIALLAADRFTARWPGLKLLQAVGALSFDARRLACSRWAVPLVLLTLLAHLNLVVSAAFIGAALGLPMSVLDYALFMPLVIVATVIPISVSGWGLREGLLLVLLGRIGISEHDALAFSLLIGFFAAISSLPGLPLWWALRRKQPLARSANSTKPAACFRWSRSAR